MAYTALDPALPNPATQAGTALGDSTRKNIVALRDAVVGVGMVQGFAYYPSGGTAAEPQSGRAAVRGQS